MHMISMIVMNTVEPLLTATLNNSHMLYNGHKL